MIERTRRKRFERRRRSGACSRSESSCEQVQYVQQRSRGISLDTILYPRSELASNQRQIVRPPVRGDVPPAQSGLQFPSQQESD